MTGLDGAAAELVDLAQSIVTGVMILGGIGLGWWLAGRRP